MILINNVLCFLIVYTLGFQGDDRDDSRVIPVLGKFGMQIRLTMSPEYQDNIVITNITNCVGDLLEFPQEIQY